VPAQLNEIATVDMNFLKEREVYCFVSTGEPPQISSGDGGAVIDRRFQKQFFQVRCSTVEIGGDQREGGGEGHVVMKHFNATNMRMQQRRYVPNKPVFVNFFVRRYVSPCGLGDCNFNLVLPRPLKV
jgi:hypothetical protein